MSRILDYIDRRILDELQENGRLPIVELASRVNLTKTPCAERVRRLERDGIITGYKAVVDPRKVDRFHVMIVHVMLDATSGGILDEFNREALSLHEIEACMLIAGNFDYLLKVRTRDIAHFRTVLSEKIVKLPGVKQTNSFAVMELVKDTHLIEMASVDAQMLSS